jgi:hypothetical protein
MNIPRHNQWLSPLIGLISSSLPIASQAAPPDFLRSIDTNPQSIVEYRVVGVTQTRTSGLPEVDDSQGNPLHGIDAMNQLCQEEFGPAARFARAAEAHGPPGATSYFPDDATYAWVDATPTIPLYMPDRAGTATPWTATPRDFDFVHFTVVGASPRVAQAGFSCASWTTDSSFAPAGGAALSRSGEFVGVSCNVPRNVVCAAPVVVPAGP